MNPIVLPDRPLVIPTTNHESYGYDLFSHLTMVKIKEVNTLLSIIFYYTINFRLSILVTYLSQIEYLMLFNLITRSQK